MEILLPFSVVIRIKKISVNMVNFKSCKHKVLLSLIPSSSMVLLLVLLKNKTRSLNLLFPQYSYHFFFFLSLSFITTKTVQKRHRWGWLRSAGITQSGSGGTQMKLGSIIPQTGTQGKEPGFRVQHSVHVLFLPLTHPGS